MSYYKDCRDCDNNGGRVGDGKIKCYAGRGEIDPSSIINAFCVCSDWYNRDYEDEHR